MREPGDGVDRGRRLAAGLAVAAPLVVGAVAARRVRAALVGARDFADSRTTPGPFPKTLWSPSGGPRTLVEPPRRIVSTYLGADELVAVLVDPARVMGVSAYADDGGTSNCAGLFPPRVVRLRSDPETIFALEPDLVLVAGFTDADALRLIDASGLPVARWSRFDSFADILGQLALVGAAVGAEAQAAQLAAGIARQLAEVEGRVRAVRPRRVLYFDPPTFTMGRGTLVDEILTLAGGANVVREVGITGPAEIDLETILALDPEVVFLPSYAENGSSLRALAGTPIWREVPAVRAGKVYEIPGAWIATVSHHAARGLGRVARVLHPELFVGQTK
jgi:iron complex transport system substrate-binding protein